MTACSKNKKNRSTADDTESKDRRNEKATNKTAKSQSCGSERAYGTDFVQPGIPGCCCCSCCSLQACTRTHTRTVRARRHLTAWCSALVYRNTRHCRCRCCFAPGTYDVRVRVSVSVLQPAVVNDVHVYVHYGVQRAHLLVMLARVSISFIQFDSVRRNERIVSFLRSLPHLVYHCSAGPAGTPQRHTSGYPIQ